MVVDRAACALQAVFLCLLISNAHAASVVFGDGLRSVPVFAWLVVFAMSTISGLVALLNRVMKELNHSGRVRWPKVFAASHMTGSWLAGLIAFLLGLSNAWSEWLTDLGIILASFGGAVSIEKMADKWLSNKLGYDVTAPDKLGGPETRMFADTEAEAPPAPPSVPVRSHGAPGPIRPRPAFPSDLTPLDD